MRKKSLVITVCTAVLAVSLVATIVIESNNRIEEYKQQIENEYSRSFSELNSGVNSISLLLEKTRYVTTAAQMSSLAAELFSEAELAKSALLQLPISEGPETVNRFLSQVGNYALSISKNLINGEKISEKQEKNLKILSDTAKTIAEAVSDSEITYNNSNYWANELEDKLNSSEEIVSLADSLTELEENLTDYPTLIYDGPYSDHIMKREPLMLENKMEISERDGRTIAADILDIGIDQLKFSGEENGDIEAYRYSGENTSVSVSKKGGYVIYFRKNREVEESKLKYETCLSGAKAFLEKSGYKNMKETYYFTDGGVCVINFAYLDGQTICYTDLIKVGVAVDNGEILFFEAKGYLFNHTERAFESAAYTKEQAQERISHWLEVSDVKVALVPSDSTAEKRCYEFTCISEEGREILIYINVMTLEEEQIFILLKTDGGVLAK